VTSSFILISRLKNNVCKISQYKVYQDGTEVLNQGKFDDALSLKGLPKYANYTVKFFVHNQEIDGVIMQFIIPRDNEISL
jgi:hypothetical protein